MQIALNRKSGSAHCEVLDNIARIAEAKGCSGVYAMLELIRESPRYVALIEGQVHLAAV